MHLGDDLGLREVQEVGVALEVALVRGEARAPELLLAQAAALQEHAPGAVQDGDPLAEQGVQALARVHADNPSGRLSVRPAKPLAPDAAPGVG